MRLRSKKHRSKKHRSGDTPDDASSPQDPDMGDNQPTGDPLAHEPDPAGDGFGSDPDYSYGYEQPSEDDDPAGSDLSASLTPLAAPDVMQTPLTYPDMEHMAPPLAPPSLEPEPGLMLTPPPPPPPPAPPTYGGPASPDEPEPPDEPVEPAAPASSDEPAAPDSVVGDVLTGADHDNAVDALNQLIDTEARGATPTEMLQRFTDMSVLTKWETLRDKITAAKEALAANDDVELAAHAQEAADRLAVYAAHVCDHLAEQVLRWRQDVLDARCDQFVRLCHKAITGNDPDADDEPADTAPAAPAAPAAAAAGTIPVAALRTAAEWASVTTDTATIGGLINAYANTPPSSAAAAAAEELRSVPLAPILGHEITTLAEHIVELVSQATATDLLADREFTPTPPTWGELSQKHGTTEQTAQKVVTQDTKLIHTLLVGDQHRVVRWAVAQLQKDLGVLAPADTDTINLWRSRLGEPHFETLRFLAHYVHEDGWLVYGTAAPRSRILAALDNAAGGDWLTRTDDLLTHIQGLSHEAGLALLTESDAWREIGDGWMVRWDGTLVDKAARVMQLVGEPMTSTELVEAIGSGTPKTLVTEMLAGTDSTLVRVDRQFRLAPTEWGHEPYTPIAGIIDRKIDFAGGVASISGIITEAASDFGIDESAVRARLETGPYTIEDDEVRHHDSEGRPKSPLRSATKPNRPLKTDVSRSLT